MRNHKSRLLFLLLFLLTLAISATTVFAAAKKPKKIKLNKNKLTIYVGNTYKLKASFTPKKANKKVTWKSSNKKIVTVSSKGKLKAKKAGKATITVTSKVNKKIKAKCKVTVKKKTKKTIVLKSMTLYDKDKGFDLTDGDGILLDIGYEYTPAVKFNPSNATYKDVKWQSSDTSVFTVDKNGKCTGVSGGTATLTCSSVKYPEIKAECTVEVMKPKTVKDDEELLETVKVILARTCEPLYRKLQGNDPSRKNEASGKPVWSVAKNLNGTMNYINAYGDSSWESISSTYCMYSAPTVTVKYVLSSSANIRDSLRDGSYDFKTDPSYVIIGWSMWTSDTTKAEMQKMLNTAISDDIFNQLKTYKSLSSSGRSVVIVYGKNAAGELCGKYAGFINYNAASNAAAYTLVGVDPDNTEIYGEMFSGYAAY